MGRVATKVRARRRPQALGGRRRRNGGRPSAKGGSRGARPGLSARAAGGGETRGEGPRRCGRGLKRRALRRAAFVVFR